MATPNAIPSMPERVELIMRQVCAQHGISLSEMVGPRAFKAFARARFEAMHRIHTELKFGRMAPSLPQIGRWFNRDHTTVLHALRRYEEIHGFRDSGKDKVVHVCPRPRIAIS